MFLFFGYPQSTFAESGYSVCNDLFVDYSFVNGAQTRKEADALFVKAYDSPTEEEKEKNYQKALQKYFVLTKAYPNDSYAYTQIARIHAEKDEEKLAKKYFFHASNLESTNPYMNYYFGEYYLKRADFTKALKFYLKSYNNGYQNNYYTNLKLANIYEKLGDLKKSMQFYQKAYSINPNDTEIYEKIQSIGSLNYEQSEYYHSIRE